MFDLNQLRSHGDDVFISPLASLSRPHLICVGNHVAIDEFTTITTALELGSYIHISKHVGIIGGPKAVLKMSDFTNISLGGRIVCGSDEFLGHGLISAPGIPEEFHDNLIIEPVVFERFANTGASVTILPGVTLPEGVVIGAGSLVRKSDELEPWTVYAGNPLRKIRIRPRERMLEFAQKLGHP